MQGFSSFGFKLLKNSIFKFHKEKETLFFHFFQLQSNINPSVMKIFNFKTLIKGFSSFED